MAAPIFILDYVQGIARKRSFANVSQAVLLARVEGKGSFESKKWLIIRGFATFCADNAAGDASHLLVCGSALDWSRTLHSEMLICLTRQRTKPLFTFTLPNYKSEDQQLSSLGAGVSFKTRVGVFDNSEQLVPRSYELPELSWNTIAGRLETTTIKILKFDARLEASGLAAGWQSRCDMIEAVRAMILDGQMLDVGDLVLHDAGMDVRHPTHELTRAAAALRARRTALARKAPWPLSIDGLAALRGIAPVKADSGGQRQPGRPDRDDEATYLLSADDADPWKAHFAEIDALLDRTNKVLAGETALPKSRSHLVYDPDQDEAEAEDLWLDVVKRTSTWPAVAAAAVTWQAWLDLNLYTRQPWLGLIMAASILRARGLTSALLPLAGGFKRSRFRPQGREGETERLEGFCQVLEEALTVSHKDLDRLVLARELMGRVTAKTRSNSKLPALVELFLSRPLVTVPLGAKLLDVTPKAIDLMLTQLGGALPRELTGRTRYRAWGIV